MKWFLNFSTRNKLLLSFSLLILFLVMGILNSYSGITSIQDSQRKIYKEDLANALDMMSIRANINGIRAALLDMLIVEERVQKEAWEKDIIERTNHIDSTMQILFLRNSDKADVVSTLQEFDKVKTLFQETRDTEISPMIYAGKDSEAQKLILNVQTERYLKMRTIIEDLGQKAITSAQNSMIQSELEAANSAKRFLILGLVSILAALIITFYLNRVIAIPLKNISKIAGLVSKGDLTVYIPADSRSDEVGILSQTFSKMIENLSRVTSDILDGINVLGSTASEILAGTSQIAAGASETATAVSETTTTVEEVKQTAQVSSQKAKTVSDSAQKAAQVSQLGKKSVEQTIEGMTHIREQMESVADSIVRLSEQSQAIGEIISSVNDLAEQSNLLAVNAAIEAAKAGEQGKGFAVVAQEVKSLAEQSKQATAQVRTILMDVQKATSAAVMAAEQGSKAVEAGVRQSAEAGDAIKVLSESMVEAAQSATQIAASSQQQLVGMDQVALAMENIKQASTQNAASTKQAEQSAKNLHELGQKLKILVEQYKVKQ
jgi:methyl-accepting chemotaxis protein